MRAHAAVLAIVTLQVVVLVVTGAVLCFTYQPHDSALSAPATLVRWLLFHTLVVGSALGALLAVAWRRATAQRDDVA